jgi:hypothetical protein
MVKLLFENASAAVKVNGAPMILFDIQREVRQGYPLVLNLFLMVVKVLNLMVTMGVANGTVKEITLPIEGQQQVITQYIDNTLLTLLEEEVPFRNLIQTLDAFCCGSELILNYNKSKAY